MEQGTIMMYIRYVLFPTIVGCYLSVVVVVVVVNRIKAMSVGITLVISIWRISSSTTLLDSLLRVHGPDKIDGIQKFQALFRQLAVIVDFSLSIDPKSKGRIFGVDLWYYC